jgi:uncharacterized RDD family membrane protein YckC
VQTSVPGLRYAGFTVRFAALLIDLLIIRVAVGLGVFVFGRAGIYLPFELTFILAFLLYSVLLTGRWGRTAGKAALGLRVQYSQDTGPGYGKALFRETICKFFSAAFLFIGFLWAAFSRRKQAWHDYLSRSTVVQDMDSAGRARLLATLVLALLGVLLGVGFYPDLRDSLAAGRMAVPSEYRAPSDLRSAASLREAGSLGNTEREELRAWLGEHGKDPQDYAVEAAAGHRLTIFGELHHVREDLQFLNRIIPELYHRAGVTCIALEVCRAEDNADLARLVEAAAFDSALALRIARHSNWPDCGSRDYWEVFGTVWRVNRGLPPGERRMRVIGIDSRTDLASFALAGLGDVTARGPVWERLRLLRLPDDILRVAKRDEIMAANVKRYALDPGERTVVWIGANHSSLDYRMPVVFDGRMIRQWGRMGFMLRQKYGTEVFQIRLHDSNEWSPAIIGLIEELAAGYGSTPTGFDIAGSPFAVLRDSRSRYFEYQPGVCFADLAEGYVFLAPIGAQTRCAWLEGYISQEMFMRDKPYFEAVCGHRLADAAEANRVFAARNG